MTPPLTPTAETCPTLVVAAESEFVVSGGQLQVANIQLPYPLACKFPYTFSFEAAGLDLDAVEVKVLQATGPGEEAVLKRRLWEKQQLDVFGVGCVFHSLVSVHNDLFPAEGQYSNA